MRGKRVWALLDSARQKCVLVDGWHAMQTSAEACTGAVMGLHSNHSLVPGRCGSDTGALASMHDGHGEGWTCVASTQGWHATPQSPSACLQSSWPGRRGFATTSTSTQRKRRDPNEPQASGPKVNTTAPWPWVDTTRPYVLPVWVGTTTPKPTQIQDAITKVKASIPDRTASSPTAQLSGRPRPKSASEKDSMELTMTFLTDPRKSDQIVRGVAVLPHGSGKKVRIAVFAKGEAADIAKAQGADVIGDDELIQQIISTDGAVINFDQVIATPEFAKPLSRAGRILGPKGLMPNAKMGTLTEDVASAVKAMRAGRFEFRVGRDKMLQVVVGKASFSDAALIENITALVQCVLESRPPVLPGSGVEGYISRMYLKSSHTPAVLVDPKSCVKAPPSLTQDNQQQQQLQ